MAEPARTCRFFVTALVTLSRHFALNWDRERLIVMVSINANKQWSEKDITVVKKLVKENTPTRVIAMKLGRTEDGVRSKLADLNISLKPVNQSPYNRRKK